MSPCQRNCPIKQDIATYIDYVSQGRYVITFERVRYVDDTMRVRELPELKKVLPVAASA